MKLSRKLMMVSGDGSNPPDFLELVGTNFEDKSNSSNNFSVNLPAHQAGDVIVVACAADDDTTFTLREGSTAGWLLTSDNSPSVTLGVVTKVATSDSEVLLMRSGEDRRVIVSAVFRSKTGRTPKIERGGANISSGTSHTIAEFIPSGGVRKYTYIHAYGGAQGTLNYVVAPDFTVLALHTLLGYPRVSISAKQTENTSEGPFSITVGSGGRISMLLAAWEE